MPNIGPAVTVSRASNRACSAGTSFATNIPPSGHFAITSPSSTVRNRPSREPAREVVVEQQRLHRREREAEQERADAPRRLAREALPAELDGAAVAAEPLRTVEVRQAFRADAVEDRVHVRRAVGVADEDAEAVAAQVAGLELVGVPAGLQDADAVAVELRDVRLALLRHRHPLPRDGVAVLEAGGADVARMRAEPLGDRAGEELRRDPALLDPEVQVIARPGRLVGRHLLDLEVVVAHADPPADAGQLGGEQRRRHRGVVHGTEFPKDVHSSSQSGGLDIFAICEENARAYTWTDPWLQQCTRGMGRAWMPQKVQGL